MLLHDLQIVQLTNGGIGSVRLELALRQCSAEVILQSEPQDVVTSLESLDAPACVIDLDIPNIPESFFEDLARMRGSGTPIHTLGCGSPGTSDRIGGLLGTTIDDFILRPIDTDELAIRLKRILAGDAPPTEPTILEEGDLRLDIASRDVLVDGELVMLTSRERSVLQILMRDSGEVISKSALAGRISSLEEEIAPQTVETYVHGLRKKLKSSVVDIHTVRGAGYLLKDQSD